MCTFFIKVFKHFEALFPNISLSNFKCGNSFLQVILHTDIIMQHTLYSLTFPFEFILKDTTLEIPTYIDKIILNKNKIYFLNQNSNDKGK